MHSVRFLPPAVKTTEWVDLCRPYHRCIKYARIHPVVVFEGVSLSLQLPSRRRTAASYRKTTTYYLMVKLQISQHGAHRVTS